MTSHFRRVRFATAFWVIIFLPNMLSGQQAPAAADTQDTQPQAADNMSRPSQDTTDKRIFGILPNYRTSPSLMQYTPVSPKGKFGIASEDAFDRGTLVLAVAFAGEAQLIDSNPSFGQGVKGYARYLGRAYADLVIGDFMTEAVFPAILHQDPRYFRRGTGNGLSRLGYAMGQIFWTHTDTGGTAFNYSEIAGNSLAVAISNAYYPENRNTSSAVSKLCEQVGVDMASNILREFWPDLSGKLSRKRHWSGKP